ncbi:MarR family transcriptional regulator [Candidatus Acetothermia bacterium]|nr:MarR family transcriptional regulator [Candidatus Acetothermia bacterium]MBI3460641.1 MarR family transcriptional regulator [Candidatus Acetothermia bacterium]
MSASSKQPKVSKKKTDEALNLFGRMLEGALKQPELAPDRLAMIVLSEEMEKRVLTPERLRLLKALGVHESTSVTGLAKAVKRSLEAVSRGLRILHQYGLVEFTRNGHAKQPKLAKDLILIPLR